MTSYVVKGALVVLGIAIGWGMVIAHELGEYAEEINPYSKDAGNDFDEME